MKEFNYVITDKDGVHARPAGELVKLAKNYKCNISMKKDDKAGDCKKIFTLMALGVKCGNEVVFCFDGEDENEAYEAFNQFVSANM